MAVGRIGGTKSKIRGKVGGDIYQLKRDPNGILFQSVYAQNQNPKYTNTEAQAKNRCIMGQIERMWHIIPDVIRDAYAKIAPSSLAFQHFSKINYDYVRSQFSLSETAESTINWKAKRDLSAPAGEWLLCDGTLPEVFFNQYSWAERYNNYIDWYYLPSDESYKVSELTKHIGYQSGDILRFYTFVDFPDETPAYIEVIDTQLNPKYKPNSNLPFPISEDLFVPVNDTSWKVYAGNDRGLIKVRLKCPDDSQQRIIACATLQIIRPSDKQTLFSSCRFRWYQTPTSKLYPRRTAYDVWNSWLNS